MGHDNAFNFLKTNRFPRELIAHAVWLYIRFNLSLREVEEMLLEHGIEVSYETIRRWTFKFGPLIARNLRKRLVRSRDVWHLDEALPGRVLRSNVPRRLS